MASLGVDVFAGHAEQLAGNPDDFEHTGAKAAGTHECVELHFPSLGREASGAQMHAPAFTSDSDNRTTILRTSSAAS